MHTKHWVGWMGWVGLVIPLDPATIFDNHFPTESGFSNSADRFPSLDLSFPDPFLEFAGTLPVYSVTNPVHTHMGLYNNPVLLSLVLTCPCSVLMVFRGKR